MAKSPVDQFKRATARRLRSRATNAETTLWRHLRRLETRGTHFRRQVPIGNYVADFACLTARLVIEVDGSQHARIEEKARDEMRTRWLEAEGYRIVRFWNNEIDQNIRGVLDVIYQALYGSCDAEPHALKHTRQRSHADVSPVHPTPARKARRPSPSRGG